MGVAVDLLNHDTDDSLTIKDLVSPGGEFYVQIKMNHYNSYNLRNDDLCIIYALMSYNFYKLLVISKQIDYSILMIEISPTLFILLKNLLDHFLKFLTCVVTSLS